MENNNEHIKENKSVNISTIRINPDYSKLLSPLSNSEYVMLKDSIKKMDYIIE